MVAPEVEKKASADNDNTVGSTISLEEKLLAVIRRNETENSKVGKEVDQLLRAGADVWYQEEKEGKSALIVAASLGNYDVVDRLLLRGAPWCAQDRTGRCAGEHALLLGTAEGQRIVDRLVNAGVQTELLFRALESRKGKSKTSDEGNGSKGKKDRLYLKSNVRYDEGELIDEEGRGVMMKWEGPLMEVHADVLCESGGSVLNIGFGLGLIDTAIQERNVSHHTIIEAHPQVYARMESTGWTSKPNVTVIFGRWQDHIASLSAFDAVFFDSFDDVSDLDEFHIHLPSLVKPGGIYSYFNGVCADNLFFQGVASELIVTLLRQRGFEGKYTPMEVKCTEDEGWKKTKFRYFNQDLYFLPVFKRLVGKDEPENEST